MKNGLIFSKVLYVPDKLGLLALRAHILHTSKSSSNELKKSYQ